MKGFLKIIVLVFALIPLSSANAQFGKVDPNIQISVLTPLPGTRLMKALQAEGRIIYDDFPKDWEKYRFSYLVHRPNGIKPDVVYTGDNYIKDRLYSFPAYHSRLLSTLVYLKSKTKFMTAVMLNKALKKSWQNSHYYNNYGKHL